MRKEMRIAGTGGMGVVLAGVIVGHAAVVHAGLNAVQSQSYGSEARGTAAKSEVIISDGEIKYPKVRGSDYFVVMSQKALEMYIDDAKKGSVVIGDPDLVDLSSISGQYEVVAVKAIKTADEIGLRLAANMVMLGALVKASRVFSVQALEKAVTDLVPKKHLAKNIQALKAGMDLT
ncbi:2-oxoacid:ferredoxin oxidoreductase subunit gamma [Candidatus Thorarchaeota archaeon]|nr:MAG: 2-oxoacid:ferredoxin oxidoreductase subunit gamma [Candidatus Thorarchaeota archaeon]